MWCKSIISDSSVAITIVVNDTTAVAGLPCGLLDVTVPSDASHHPESDADSTKLASNKLASNYVI